MKKHYIFCLAASLLIYGCDTPEQVEEPKPYATINSENDVVYIYKLVGESFDLTTIDTSIVSQNTPVFSCEQTGITIENNNVTFNNTGIYHINISDGKNHSLGVIQAVVNEKEENRYNYPNLDLNNFVQRSGSSSQVSVTDNKITIDSRANATWNRITYSLDEYSALNYTVECDITFKEANNNRRWFGLVFRSDQEKGIPYYQLDIRKNPALSDAVELTYVYDQDKYSYPFKGKWGENGPRDLFDANTPIHMKVSLNGYIASCSLTTGEYYSNFEVTLPKLNTGDFGFQTTESLVEIENISVSFDENIVINSFSDPRDSYVNIKDDISIDPIKPQLILSGPVFTELYFISNEYQQIYVKAKENSTIEIYDINDQLMDMNLNELISVTLGKTILNIQVEDEKTLDKVLGVCNSYGLVDAVIWSSNTSLLDKTHKTLPGIRLGYIPTNLNKFETFDEIGAVCRTAGKHYANQILIDTDILNKENVNKAKGLGYNVVANAKNGDNYSLIDGALDGCSLILVGANLNTSKQAKKLYDNSLFDASSNKQSMFAAPYVTGHRGSGNTGSNSKTQLPENTIESFKFALDSGANSVEIDIHTTADNKLAVIHNGTTGEYAQKDLIVKSSTLAQLQALPLRMGNGTYSSQYKIPSLDELFDALNEPQYADKSMVVEVKDGLASTGIAAIELAKQKNWYNKITIITFSDSVASQIRNYDPGVQCAYLGTVYRTTNAEYWLANESYYNLGVGIAGNFGTVSKESIQECTARGQVEWLWTFNAGNASKLLELISYGNKAFTTNYVADFSNNNFKLEVEGLNNSTLSVGQNINLNVSAVSYIGTKTQVSNSQVIVLSDNATASGSTITKTGDGTIYAVVKHETKWIMSGVSKTFVIYSDLISIK